MTEHFYKRPRWVDDSEGLPKGISMRTLVEETFVAIDGLTPYAVSNYGTVINVDTGKELRQHTDKDGRKKVTIRRYSVDGTRHKYSLFVHRWVAMAFFVNYSADVEVLHKNGDYSDNSVLNLTLGGPCREATVDVREASS